MGGIGRSRPGFGRGVRARRSGGRSGGRPGRGTGGRSRRGRSGLRLILLRGRFGLGLFDRLGFGGRRFLLFHFGRRGRFRRDFLGRRFGRKRLVILNDDQGPDPSGRRSRPGRDLGDSRPGLDRDVEEEARYVGLVILGLDDEPEVPPHLVRGRSPLKGLSGGVEGGAGRQDVVRIGKLPPSGVFGLDRELKRLPGDGLEGLGIQGIIPGRGRAFRGVRRRRSEEKNEKEKNKAGHRYPIRGL